MYYTYIIKCADNSLYCGITTNLERRLLEHNSSNLAAKYTKSRRPVKLVYHISLNNRSEASKEELRIKNLSRDKKLELINLYDKNR